MLDAYVKRPEPSTTLVFVAADVDRTRRLYKSLQKHATIVECWGLKASRDGKVDLRQVARAAEQMVRQAATEAGQQIEPAAARLVAERAGADIATLRGDIERLMLYAAGKKTIELKDAQEVVSAETSQDDWAVTNAIRAETGRSAASARAGARRRRRVVHDPGTAGVVRAREAAGGRSAARSGAVDALFRTDLELKSSGGDPRVLLERLVVELCRR